MKYEAYLEAINNMYDELAYSKPCGNNVLCESLIAYNEAIYEFDIATMESDCDNDIQRIESLKEISSIFDDIMNKYKR